MKHPLFFLALFIVATLLGSCSREDIQHNPVTVSKEITIQAVAPEEGPATRTIRLDNGNIWWTPGDQISVFYGSGADGFVVSLTVFLRLYGGPNYGLRDILWEDVSGKWMTVSDLSHKGWGADTGVLLCWKHLTVMAGGSYTHGSPIQAELGFGLLF